MSYKRGPSRKGEGCRNEEKSVHSATPTKASRVYQSQSFKIPPFRSERWRNLMNLPAPSTQVKIKGNGKGSKKRSPPHNHCQLVGD